MKIDRKTFIILFGIMIGTVCMAFGASKLFAYKNNGVEEYVYLSQEKTLSKEKEMSNDESLTNADMQEEVEISPLVREEVYDGLTLEELGDKLDRSLSSVLVGQGDFIASYSLEKGVDPYLATAIMLHETGCSYKCSSLVVNCNNVGGMKGKPSCGNGSYLAFATLEDGITSFINNLANNYYAYGLNTPELMNSKYAASPAWATRVNAHIKQIKSK